jgi:AraC family transcriptional regulator
MVCSLETITQGQVIRTRSFGGFRITETTHDPGQILEPHSHRHPSISIVQSGSYIETVGKSAFEFVAGSVFYKPGDHVHRNEYGHEGARTLLIEIIRERQAVLEHEHRLPRDCVELGDGRTSGIATAIAREFLTADSTSALALEGLTIELLAATLRARASEAESRPPVWLARAIEVLREHFSESISLIDLAADVDIHPVHVARVFRRHTRCSVGEYLRQLRVEYAAQALRETTRKCSEIAYSAGFCDQSHFSRCFKQQMGVTPDRYRTATQSR